MVTGALSGVCIGIYVLTNKFIKTIGTAFLGSYILTRGVGFIFGGFPNVGDVVTMQAFKDHDRILWYLLGFIVFFIAGSIVQWRLFYGNAELEAKHDEMLKKPMMNEKYNEIAPEISVN